MSLEVHSSGAPRSSTLRLDQTVGLSEYTCLCHRLWLAAYSGSTCLGSTHWVSGSRWLCDVYGYVFICAGPKAHLYHALKVLSSPKYQELSLAFCRRRADVLRHEYQYLDQGVCVVNEFVSPVCTTRWLVWPAYAFTCSSWIGICHRVTPIDEPPAAQAYSQNVSQVYL